MKLPKLTWELVKNLVFIITVASGLFYHFRDKAVTAAKYEATQKELITSTETQLKAVNVKLNSIDNTISEISNELKENRSKWEAEKEHDGKVDMYISMDSNSKH